MTEKVSVAEAKERFSELVGRAAYAGECFIIERRGKPMAALIGLDDLNRLEEQQGRTFKAEKPEPQGLLAAARALADYEGFEEVMAEVHRSRRHSRGRRVKLA